MTLLTFTVLLVTLGGFGLLAYLLTRPRDSVDLLLKQELDRLQKSHDENIRQVHDQLGKLTGEIGKRLEENFRQMNDTNRHVGDRLDNAARVVGEVKSRLSQLEAATQQVHNVGKDIAMLQESLRSPKFRGGFGELLLENLLKQVLPPESFELQYLSKSGERVDAVIRTKEGLIPVDSKFPLPNFRKLVEASSEEEKKIARKDFISDVKKHIDDISKYIRPEEATLPFALMYIPAENIYYEAIIKDETLEADLLSYAQKKRVFPVSPNSFYGYLQTIAIGLRGMKIEEWAHSLDTHLQRLKEDLKRFVEEFAQIGLHLKNLRQKYESAEKRLEKFGDKMADLEAPAEQERLKVLPSAH
ncbi:MAG: DNA recombination protein RmuC [Deltaproteobacteria bacterium]|nr:DNA recombination protein RmuC [Deltaproteobacteria bacterium]